MNLATGQALLLSDKELKLDITAVEEAIVKAGFVYQGKAADRSLTTQEQEQSQEERTLTIKVVAGIGLSLLVMAVSMPGLISGLNPVLGCKVSVIINRFFWAMRDSLSSRG